MSEIESLEKVTIEIKKSLDGNKDILLFAFNSTGKTRISYELNDNKEGDCKIESLCYNSIVEDYFTWDNESKTMGLYKNSWLYNFLNDEGLDGEIIKNYTNLVDTKIEPVINFEDGSVKFNITTGDERAAKSIKISKGEETLFKWAVFYTALKTVIEILSEKEENRSTDSFNNLKYIIVDDPVSSLDDYRIYTLSTQLLELIEIVHEKQININFLITTHHTLFFNIIANKFKNRNKCDEGKKQEKFISYDLRKGCEGFILKKINNKEPLTYHLQSLKRIQNDILNNQIRKTDFNLFRSILEKVGVFLGYDRWRDLFKNYPKVDDFQRLINMNSHERYSEMEFIDLPKEQIDWFIDAFEYFKSTYKFNM